MLVLSFVKNDSFYWYGMTLREDYHSPYNHSKGKIGNLFRLARSNNEKRGSIHLMSLLYELEGEKAETSCNPEEVVLRFVQFLSQFDFELLHTCPVSVLDSANQELVVAKLRISQELEKYLNRARLEEQALTVWNQYFNEQLGRPLLEVERSKCYGKDSI